MADKSARWETDKEWARWTLRDEIYGFIRNHWMPTVIASLIGAFGSVLSFVKSHPTLGVGIVTPTLMLMVLVVLARIDGRKRAAASAAIQDAKLVSPEPSAIVQAVQQPPPEASVVPPVTAQGLDISAKARISQGAKYYESFKSTRPFADLTEEEWVKRGTLYEMSIVNDIHRIQTRRALQLRYLPDSPGPDRPAVTLLLLIYGYHRIYQANEVIARNLETGLYLSGCRKRSVGTLSEIEKLVGSMYLNTGDLLDIDEVAESPILNGLISKKVRLSKGGFYRLTDSGIAKAEPLFEDLVERA